MTMLNNGSIIIEIAGEPVGKGRARFARTTGHAYTPTRTRRYEDQLRYVAQQTMNGQAPLQGPLFVQIDAYFPIPNSWSRKKREAALVGSIKHVTRPDIDNLVKTVDSLNQVVWGDDRQIVTCVVSKHYTDRPRLRIEVTATS
jgi:Holliday junction resolvase RusA-like endonuclease